VLPKTTEPTITSFGEETETSLGEDTTTIADDGATTTVRRSTATTVRKTTATTARAVAAPRPTAPPTTRGPFCDASAADTTVNSYWTVTVNSSFPNSEVTIDVRWNGGSGNYTGRTDGGGTWTKSQRAGPSMRGQTVRVVAYVGGKSCSTSFTVS
jgi:hypothetical protein